MKRIIKLNENDLRRIVKRVLREQKDLPTVNVTARKPLPNTTFLGSCVQMDDNSIFVNPFTRCFANARIKEKNIPRKCLVTPDEPFSLTKATAGLPDDCVEELKNWESMPLSGVDRTKLFVCIESTDIKSTSEPICGQG